VSDTFPIKNGLKQGDTLLSLLFKFALEITIRWVKAKWEGLKLSLYISFWFMLMMLIISDIIYNLPKNKEASALISKEASQAVSADRTKCVYMSCEQNAGQDYKVKKGNKYCENVVKFRYWGATIMNQNLYLCRN